MAVRLGLDAVHLPPGLDQLARTTFGIAIIILVAENTPLPSPG
jgi:hypothetical protein